MCDRVLTALCDAETSEAAELAISRGLAALAVEIPFGELLVRLGGAEGSIYKGGWGAGAGGPRLRSLPGSTGHRSRSTASAGWPLWSGGYSCCFSFSSFPSFKMCLYHYIVRKRNFFSKSV